MPNPTTIRSYYINTLPEDYFKEAYRANFGSWGLLREELMKIRYAYKRGEFVPIHRIYIAINNGEFAGWGLTTSKNDENTQFTFMCFVKRKFRKQGLGSKILKANGNFIKKYEQRVICQVYPHSTSASALYKENNLLFLDDIISTKRIKKSYQFI